MEVALRELSKGPKIRVRVPQKLKEPVYPYPLGAFTAPSLPSRQKPGKELEMGSTARRPSLHKKYEGPQLPRSAGTLTSRRAAESRFNIPRSREEAKPNKYFSGTQKFR